MACQTGSWGAIEEEEETDYGANLASLFNSTFSHKDMLKIREQIILDIMRGKVYPAV